jgi:hypothetical protein
MKPHRKKARKEVWKGGREMGRGVHVTGIVEGEPEELWKIQ